MPWYGLVNKDTGDLVSTGTEAMFPSGDVNSLSGLFDRVDFGDTPPDWSSQIWNPTTRQLVARPAPVLISRLDDIEEWLLADPDWVAVWNNLSAARKTQIRTGLRRILARTLGNQQWRGESETVEL